MKKDNQENLEIEEVAANNTGKIGSMLKDARLKKGFKIPEISKELCIRKIYLEAIEASDYKEIPEFPYGIGFIRSYSEYLGLNSARIVQLYKEETDAKSRDEKYFVLEPVAEATAPNRKYLMISLLSLIAVYFIWFLFNEQQNAEPAVVEVIEDNIESPAEITDFPLQVEEFIPADTAASVQDEALTVIDTTVAQPAEPSPVVIMKDENFVETPVVAEPAKVVASKTGRIELKIKKETWVEVKDGSKLYISKVLQAGDSYTIPEGKGMVLSVGKSEGVETFVDGKAVEIVKATKKMGIALDKYLEANH